MNFNKKIRSWFVADYENKDKISNLLYCSARNLLHKKIKIENMIVPETLGQLKNISIEARLHLMEIPLTSLKQEINNLKRESRYRFEQFSVETFYSVRDFSADRDIIYAERGFYNFLVVIRAIRVNANAFGRG
ncbi:MAG: hypothetical protein HQM10_19940 [Candidatus Riflebacteria bacterium]|nr:hypothetical protein [Candidatus Riflebacteria bacterium]